MTDQVIRAALAERDDTIRALRADVERLQAALADDFQEKARLRRQGAAVAASIVGVIATYEEPAHWQGTVYAGCGKKAAADILERVRSLRPIATCLGG